MGHWLLILALLGATGAHLAMLQSLAWAGMLAQNTRCESLQEAVAKTFDGRHPCALCRQIAKARQSEKKPDLQIEFKKLEFPPLSAAFVFQAPDDFRLLGQFTSTAPMLAERPPVPPPRSFPS